MCTEHKWGGGIIYLSLVIAPHYITWRSVPFPNPSPFHTLSSMCSCKCGEYMSGGSRSMPPASLKHSWNPAMITICHCGQRRTTGKARLHMHVISTPCPTTPILTAACGKTPQGNKKVKWATVGKKSNMCITYFHLAIQPVWPFL